MNFLKFMAPKMTTNLKILSKFLVLLKIEAASRGLASFEQASYIAKLCNKNNFEMSAGSKSEYRPTPSLPDSLYLLLYSTVIRNVKIKESPFMDSEGSHRNNEKR